MKKYFLFLLFIFSCNPDGDDNDFETTPYSLNYPTDVFPQMIIPEDNLLTQEGVSLGKKLFFDPILSVNNTISCASCHIQENSFSDPNQYSIGVNGDFGFRNAFSLVNIGWNNSFNWDGSASSLESQVFEPVTNPIEMANSWDQVEDELNADSQYRELFKQAFDIDHIDSTYVAKAIAQFERTLISYNSRYDKFQRGEVMFTNEELDGLNIFFTERGDCFHCHGNINFMDNTFHNNALDETFSDLGLYEVTGNDLDKGLFKTPTLRNVEFSAPYMHDGRFNSLDEVIDHYNSGGVYSPTVDPLMKYINTNPYGIPGQTGLMLTQQEKNNLKAFLLTLSDEDFIQNTNFQP